MCNPRPHAELIKAWADGAEIEWYRTAYREWKTVPRPAFVAGECYRIKPRPIVVKYRRYLVMIANKQVAVSVTHKDSLLSPEEGKNFIRWIDNDWIEEVV